jgi:peptidase E
MDRHIVALGGGGFSMESGWSALDGYALRLTRKRRPRVCFVPTASGDSPEYVKKFLRAFRGRAETSFLSLFRRDARDVREFLLSQDVIYVGGGNTANLLAVWRLHGVDVIMREAWRRGVVLTGISAGMLCWFGSCVTDSFGPLARLDDGLGLLAGSACPHYDGEAGRRPTYRRLVREGLPGGYAADDFAALHFVGRRLHACVASRAGAGCYRVRRVRGRVVEEAIATRLLRGSCGGG